MIYVQISISIITFIIIAIIVMDEVLSARRRNNHAEIYFNRLKQRGISPEDLVKALNEHDNKKVEPNE